MKHKLMKIDGKPIYIHRYVMECHLGRKLKSSEEVHHIDGDPSNNNLSNLRLTSGRAEHKRIHSEMNSNQPLTRIQNDKKKLLAVEAKFGGPVKAARAVNVSYTSWHRWVNNLRAVTPQVDRALDLVLAESIQKASNGS